MRYLTLVLALALLPLTSSLAAAQGETLTRIGQSGQINIGFREAEPPMSFTDQNGKAVGYSVDLCTVIAAAAKEQLGLAELQVNFVPVTADTRFDAIEKGEIDILCGATTKTLSRAERVSFTQLTFVTGASLLSLDNNRMVNLQSLAGKKVAVVTNTTTIEALERGLKAMAVDTEVVPVPTAMVGMEMLDKGEVDAFSSDQVVLIGQVLARQSDKDYFLSQELFSFEPFAFAVKRGDVDFQLLADRVLSRLNRSGRILEIYRKWFSRFGSEPTPALSALYQLNSTPE